jgi:hypothetical protein
MHAARAIHHEQPAVERADHRGAIGEREVAVVGAIAAAHRYQAADRKQQRPEPCEFRPSSVEPWGIEPQTSRVPFR